MCECPRCGAETYEKLKTHDYCSSCNYSPIGDGRESIIPDWALRAIGMPEWTNWEVACEATY